MLSRRLVLHAALAFPAPPIVRFARLMRVKTAIPVRPPSRIGLIDRRAIASDMPRIEALRRAGLTLHEIATALNAAAGTQPFQRVVPWSDRLLLQTMREAARLRAEAFATREEK